MAFFPAPKLCQGSDEDLLIATGDIIFPGTVERRPGENGLRLWVEGDPTDPAAREEAAATFQTLLGVLRAWRPVAGELEEERRAGLGEGTVRDLAGNQWLEIGTVLEYATFDGEVESFALDARRAIDASQDLRNALWLNGRANRVAADYAMIHEYAEKEFGGSKGIRDLLNISVDAQGRLTRSANSLSPLKGGRHVKYEGPVPLDLEQQREFVSDLLRRWIRASSASSS